MRLLVDADPIIYACAFAAEDHSYYLVTRNELGALSQAHFANGDELKKWKKANKESESPLEIEEQIQQVDVGPVSHAKAALRTQLGYIKGAVAAHWGLVPEEMHTTLILSGKTNFRNAVSQVREYKGNRQEVRRPEHHGALREYMKRTFDAIEVENREADDEISILARQCASQSVEYVVATIDKDLDQIPGLKFDYLKKVFYEVDPTEAKMLFWAQALSGDATDNIPGVPGVGKVKAEKMVNAWIEEGIDDEGIWQCIVGVFEQGKAHKKCEYLERSPESVALETARLVHLQTYPGQLWSPPGIEDERVEVGLDD